MGTLKLWRFKATIYHLAQWPVSYMLTYELLIILCNKMAIWLVYTDYSHTQARWPGLLSQIAFADPGCQAMNRHNRACRAIGSINKHMGS